LKKLSNLLNNIEIDQIIGDKNLMISNLSFDSRKIETNGLFIATKGTQCDAHQYINQTIENGAIAIVCEDLPENLNINGNLDLRKSALITNVRGKTFFNSTLLRTSIIFSNKTFLGEHKITLRLLVKQYSVNPQPVTFLSIIQCP
jgi:UDP-N-acetylmuramoyl-L-alanyl-D-glutamate--2,6-diaminopimelate ligase